MFLFYSTKGIPGTVYLFLNVRFWPSIACGATGEVRPETVIRLTFN